MTQRNTSPGVDAYREQISTLFATSPTSDHQQSIGLELELLPLKMNGPGNPKPIAISDEKGTGVLDIIRKNNETSTDLLYAPKEDGTPHFKATSGGNITFEPGGQIEYSSSGCYYLNEAIAEMVKHIGLINASLSPEHIKLFHGGMNPWHSVDEIGLKMQKPRYRAMDEYFQAIGPYGQQMMRLTLSIQVNLDFGCHQTARQRWFASNLLAPVLCAIFGNSPFLEGKATGFKSYRSFIWQNMDPCRTGFPNPEDLSCPEIDQVDQYLTYALDAYVIKLYREAVLNNKKERFISFKQWMETDNPNLQPNMSEWEDHISLLFPEVRPKGFLEFRTLDGPSENWWTVPIVLLTSILYDPKALNLTLELLEPYCKTLKQMLHKASQLGTSAFPDIARKVFRIALESEYADIPTELREHCERFYTTFTQQERNPADDLLDINGGKMFSVQQFRDHEQKLRETLSPPDYTHF
jgi:glutamate--cysteine ligase